MRDAQQRGYGDTPAYSREGAPQTTIAEVLTDKKPLQQNELARRKIGINLQTLQAMTGVTNEEIIRVPSLFHAFESSADNPPPDLPDDYDWPREEIVYGPGTLLDYHPGAVNGPLLDRREYIMSSQWGR